MDAILRKALSPLEKYLNQKDLVEICINRPGEVMLEDTSGDWTVKNDSSLTINNLKKIASLLATYSGQAFSDVIPAVACHIPDFGYRIQIIFGAMVESGVCFSIRVGTSRLFPLESYMDDATADRLKEAIRKGRTIIVSGGTSTGKTTFINSASRYIPDECRIVVIEDVKEIMQHHKNFVRLLKSKSGSDVAQVTYKDIINWTTRIRPDRIIMGELTTDNSHIFLRIINTGHSGCITTLHADSPEQAIDAIEQNCSLSGELHGDRIRDYVINSTDIIVQLHRHHRSKIQAEVLFIEDMKDA